MMNVCQRNLATFYDQAQFLMTPHLITEDYVSITMPQDTNYEYKIYNIWHNRS